MSVVLADAEQAAWRYGLITSHYKWLPVILTVKSSEVDAQVQVGVSSFRFKSNLTSHSHISWKKLTLISSRFMLFGKKKKTSK